MTTYTNMVDKKGLPHRRVPANGSRRNDAMRQPQSGKLAASSTDAETSDWKPDER